MLHRRLLICIFSIIALNLYAQDSSGSDSGVQLINPVFPKGSTGLIYIEGENAVSTNFANQAVSNFGCSGYRSVQLNRNTGLQGGAAFYAEFVFYVEEAGEYEFWYGGTPPGPADELSPSYASPFSISIDDGADLKVYREDMHVIEGYTPSYYWNKCNTFSLSEGSHRLRIEVSEKRAYDGRYYFYLDSLFFLNREKEQEVLAVRPEVFPSVLENAAIDNPFLSITDYQSYINSHPDDKSAYIELSLVFSLIGDYQSALKTLTKAMAIDATDPYPVVLAAKNRLWKGDVRESLALYEHALNINPDDRLLWAEAGKVAAWSAEYDKSIDLFLRGLLKFPNDMNLRVNLGLTYLWMSRNTDAAETLESAFDVASGSPEQLRKLGTIEEAAGYAEYARKVYNDSIALYPSYLDFYLMLQSSLLAAGDREGADEIGRRIESTFIPSARLQNELEVYARKLNLRDEVINSYLEKLGEDPGNLELRQELAQTYFWNGMSAEAIEQIKYVITTHAYNVAETYGRRNSELLALSDLLVSLEPFFDGFGGFSSSVRKKLDTAASELARAKKTVEAKKEAAPEELAAAGNALRDAEQSLADTVAEAERLAGLFNELKSSAENYDLKVKEFLAKEKTADEAFRAAIASSGWVWALSWQINELYGIYEHEPELASYMLGRLLMSQEQFSEASEILMPEQADGAEVIETYDDAESVSSGGDFGKPSASSLDFSSLDTGVLYTLYEALLFGGDTGVIHHEDGAGYRQTIAAEEGVRLLSEYPHIEVVENYLNLGVDPFTETDPGIYYEGLNDEAVELGGRLQSLEKETPGIRKQLNTLIKQVETVSTRELERTSYYLESDTYLIRYELGNYYLDEGLNKAASEQFRRVIAIDPWNISATYKLGVVEQRYGNWSEAMKYYKKVYQQDPGYENAVSYYNQLARLHSDRFNSSYQLINTPSEIKLSGLAGYKTEFNSFIGLGVTYNLNQQRLYRDYTGQQKGSFQMHLIEAEVPLRFGSIGLEIAPLAGVYAESLYYKTDYDFPSDESVSIQEFLKAVSTFPKFGASAKWNWKFLTVNAGWENAIEVDTIYEDRELVRKNDFELNVNTWFNLEDLELLGPLTTRTYGRLQFMDDGNLKGQAFQDVMLGITLLNNPVIRLSPSASVNFETSKTALGLGYYAPMGVLEAKGNLRAAFTFPSEDWSQALEAVIWGGTGGYWSGLGGTDASGSVKLEGGVGATFVRNGNSYYLNASGLGTFNSGGNEYWEISIALGTSLSLPGLLTN